MVQLERQVSLNALRLDVIISRLVEAVIVIYINHIPEAFRHTVIIHQAVLLKVVQAQAVLVAVIVIPVLVAITVT